MSSKKPKTILTDQDAAMSKAISLVMPESYHRLCTWHLEKNALSHLSHLYKSSSTFNNDFSKLMYYYETEKEFLDAWESLLDNYCLRDNEWLKGIFPLKKKWSMAYGRSTFSGGLRGTQLSESLNGSLRNFLKSDIDLVQFFKHFERAVASKRYAVSREIYDMTQKLPILKVDVLLLRHAREVYTSNMFGMFQDEWVKSLLVVVGTCDVGADSFHSYKVTRYGSTREHVVEVEVATSNVSCSCKLFDYLGILCSHCLKILDLMNIKEKIPEQYLLARWKKDVLVEDMIAFNGNDEVDDPGLKSVSRYRFLCPFFVKVAAIASETEEGSKLASQYGEELVRKLKEISTFADLGTPAYSTPNEDLTACLQNHPALQAKGLKRKSVTYRGKGRLKSSIEKGAEKRKGPSKHTLPQDYVHSNGDTRNANKHHSKCTQSDKENIDMNIEDNAFQAQIDHVQDVLIAPRIEMDDQRQLVYEDLNMWFGNFH